MAHHSTKLRTGNGWNIVRLHGSSTNDARSSGNEVEKVPTKTIHRIAAGQDVDSRSEGAAVGVAVVLYGNPVLRALGERRAQCVSPSPSVPGPTS